MIDQLVHQIKSKLSSGLPGRSAHLKMSHKLRYYTPPAPETATLSAVCILLYPNSLGSFSFSLMERSSKNIHDKHKGQISLPGGKKDLIDQSLQDTALRELHEELGVHPKKVNVLAPLSELYIPVSNFAVSPFIGVTDQQPEFILQESEVKALIEVDLQELLNPSNIRSTNIQISPKITLKDVPYFHLNDRVVWGATAMILSEFKQLVQ